MPQRHSGFAFESRPQGAGAAALASSFRKTGSFEAGGCKAGKGSVAMKKDLFEPELARHLGPVKAPDQLWDRVQGAASAGRSVSPVRTGPTGWNPAWGWVSAMALVALAAGLTVWL